MSKEYCSIDDLVETMECQLADYTDEVTEQMKRGIDRTAKEVNETIKEHATFGGSGKYKKSFAVKTSFEDKRNKRRTWYVKSPNYRLTHLLEKGHNVQPTGRARAFPHIEYGERHAEENLEKNIKEEIENGR